MGLGRLNVLRRGIDAHHTCAKPRQRLAHQASAAADIEHAQASEARRLLRVPPEPAAELIADIGEPHWIDAVEVAERSALVPPFVAQACKPGDLVAVERLGILRGLR